MDLFQLVESYFLVYKSIKTVCDVMVCDTQVPTSRWNLAFPFSGLEGKNSHTLKMGR